MDIYPPAGGRRRHFLIFLFYIFLRRDFARFYWLPPRLFAGVDYSTRLLTIQIGSISQISRCPASTESTSAMEHRFNLKMRCPPIFQLVSKAQSISFNGRLIHIGFKRVKPIDKISSFLGRISMHQGHAALILFILNDEKMLMISSGQIRPTQTWKHWKRGTNWRVYGQWSSIRFFFFFFFFFFFLLLFFFFLFLFRLSNAPLLPLGWIFLLFQ